MRMKSIEAALGLLLGGLSLAAYGSDGNGSPLETKAAPLGTDTDSSDIPVADIFVPRAGMIAPYATEADQGAFDRGFDLMLHRFSKEEGLGPQFNVESCGTCHEGPVIGGTGPRYRDFYIHGVQSDDGTFEMAPKGGVVRSYGPEGNLRPSLMEGANVQAKRSGMVIFGTGAISEIYEDAILANADPDDADGDGISGRAADVKGFLGRFGRKGQKASVEGFVRDPINNHAGITSVALTPEQNADLPIIHSANHSWVNSNDITMGDLTDNDDVADPELQPDEVFDLVTFAMLLAPPAPETNLHPKEKHGKELFAEMGCESCHTPALEGARGMVPLYSDLLLHDMGEDMADGLVMANATGSEFRTQPLWGLLLQRPYLHDGRADTVEEAIRWHGGEAEAARMAFVSAKKKDRKGLIAFLETLGGREQATEGLLAPDAPIPLAGEVGAPTFLANAAERKTWLKGRALFDKDFGEQDGLGPLFNGDSCRGCHFDPLATDGTPVAGGAGPLDVNVMRHGTIDENGNFIAPDYGTILHKLSIVNTPRREHTSAHNFFEVRQTPTALGLGLISAVDADDIRALADPTDADGNGIFGIVHERGDGRVGRLGWKAQVPSVREFVRDAMSAELGMTVPQETGFTFGNLSDDDGADDPELSTDEIDTIAFYMERLAPPMPTAEVPGGETLFEAVGCDSCHVGRIPGSGDSFPVPAYTDLLLHSVAPEGTPGIDDGLAVGTLFRTAPLWGVSGTAPYMHDGGAPTIRDAIEQHDGEAATVRAAFDALSEADQNTLLEFVRTR